jgi:hypothetical protein
MVRSRRTSIVSVGIVVFILMSACASLTKGLGPSNNDTPDNNSSTDPNSSETTLIPSNQGTSDDPADNFPLTPDPISVQVTLDSAHMAKGSSSGFPISVKGETADGTPFEIYLDNKLYTVDADGNLIGAFDSEVTITPVSAIEDLPFSKGFLTAVQLGPEGLLMAGPGTLTLSVPGNVEDEDMIGFAADGDGGDFHLFPVTGSYSEYYDATQFNFNVMHFSLYGVASVVQGEIEAQVGHPPASPAAQDENELAPLLPIKAPLDDLAPLSKIPSKLQRQLEKSHNRLVKPGMDKLATTKCERVTNAAYNFNEWRSKVDHANQTDYFQKQIDSDGKALHERFIECAKELCPVCMGLSEGKPDKVKSMEMLTLATFAEELSFTLGYDDFAYWRQLGNKCAEKAGVMPAGGSTGGDTFGGEGTVMTPTPLTCP